MGLRGLDLLPSSWTITGLAYRVPGLVTQKGRTAGQRPFAEGHEVDGRRGIVSDFLAGPSHCTKLRLQDRACCEWGSRYDLAGRREVLLLK